MRNRIININLAGLFLNCLKSSLTMPLFPISYMNSNQRIFFIMADLKQSGQKSLCLEQRKAIEGLETCSRVVHFQMWRLAKFPRWPGLSAMVPHQQPSPTSVRMNSNSRIDCWEWFMPVCLSLGGEGLFKFCPAILSWLQTFLNLLEVSAFQMQFFSPIMTFYFTSL